VSAADLQLLRSPRTLWTLRPYRLARDPQANPSERELLPAAGQNDLPVNDVAQSRAEEATHALRHALSGEGLDEPQLPLDAFYCRVMNEALGFFGSKLVNPKRRCLHVDDLEAMLQAATREQRKHSDLELHAASLAIEHKEVERGRPSRVLSSVLKSSPDLFNAVTHLLGYILGDQMYHALLRGRISAQEIRELFAESLEEEGVAVLIYFDLAIRIGRIRTPRSRALALPTAAG